MANTMPNVAMKQYQSVFEQTLQQEGLLQPNVQYVEFKGEGSYTWPFAGKSILKQSVAPGSVLSTSNTEFTPITTTVATWEDQEAVPDDYQADTRLNFINKIAANQAVASKRTMDQLIFNAITAETFTADQQVAADYGSTGTNSGLIAKKLIKAGNLLTKANVPQSGRAIMIHANELDSFMNDDKATSSRFVSNEPLMKGSIGNYYGFDILVYGDMDEGGLTLSGNIRTVYAFHKLALGLACNIAPHVKMFRDDNRRSDMCQVALRAGASVLQKAAIVPILCDESV